MALGYYDHAAPHITRVLPRKRGEDRITYAQRFFREMKGCGCVTLVTVKGNRRRQIARRSL